MPNLEFSDDMPGALAATAEAMRFQADEVSRETWVNVMGQYRSAGHAVPYPELRARGSGEEILQAVATAWAARPRRIDGFQ